MRRVLVVLGGAFVGLTLLSSASLAQRSDPAKAKKYQATLVTAYDACAAPNDTTSGSVPLPACHPAVPSDAVCQIDTKGGGKVSAKADPAGDVALKVKLKGILGCDGDTLQAFAGIQVTTQNCASADPGGCTTITVGFPVTGPGNCVIANGKCQIKSTVNTELGAGTLAAGDNASITLGSITLGRITVVNGPGNGSVAAAGIGLP